jgi:hypothetical protein
MAAESSDADDAWWLVDPASTDTLLMVEPPLSRWPGVRRVGFISIYNNRHHHDQALV